MESCAPVSQPAATRCTVSTTVGEKRRISKPLIAARRRNEVSVISVNHRLYGRMSSDAVRSKVAGLSADGH